MAEPKEIGTNWKGQIYDAWPDVDPRFKIRIWSPKVGGVTGLLPPTFSEKVSTQWKAPFNQAFSELTAGTQFYEQMKSFLYGTPYNPEWSLRFKKQTYMLWTGSSPLVLGGVKMIFIARDKADNDVVKPSRILQAMATPRLDKAFSEVLEPPSSLVIELGYTLRLVDAIIQVVDIQWHAPLDEDGLAARSEVTLQISSRSAYVLDKEQDYVKPVTGWEKHPLEMLKDKALSERFGITK